MRIALDYDGTYTADPCLWDSFIERCRDRHDVWIVTMRYPYEAINMNIPVIYTSRKPKIAYCEGNGIYFDVWIDDQPEFLFRNG